MVSTVAPFELYNLKKVYQAVASPGCKGRCINYPKITSWINKYMRPDTHNVCKTCGYLIPKNVCIKDANKTRCPCCSIQIQIINELIPIPQYTQLEANIILIMSKNTEGVTPRFIYKNLRISRQRVNNTLSDLIQKGLVYKSSNIRYENKYFHNINTTIYKLTEKGLVFSSCIYTLVRVSRGSYN